MIEGKRGSTRNRAMGGGGDPSAAGTWILALLMVVSAAAFVTIPTWQLLEFGPFSWHVRLPEYWQGGLEALVLCSVLVLAQTLTRRPARIVVSILASELFLRRHGVDLAVAVDLVYFEICFGLGALAMRSCGPAGPDTVVSYLRCFIAGFCLWSTAAWSMSALGYGGVHQLRWLSVVLLMVAAAARCKPWLLFVEQRVSCLPTRARWLAAVPLAWILLSFAHSATVIGSDALWYGLRGDRVLVGDGSAFSAEGLVAPVYYFPKIYELFLVPLSGLGSNSVVSGISILLLAFLVAVSYALLAPLGLRDKFGRLLGATLVMTLPAIANSALNPKPDIFAAFLLIFAWLNAARFLASRDRVSLLWFVSSLLLAVQAKLTAIPYAGILLLVTMMSMLRYRVANAAAHTPLPHDGARACLARTTLILVMIVCAFATARTLLLAGMPTIGPDPLVALWQKLGFSLAFPVGTGRWSFPHDWSDVPALALDLLFRPQRTGHVMITWTGNCWLWLALAAALASLPIFSRTRTGFASRSGDNDAQNALPGIALMLTGFAVMLCWGYQVRGGDGNYFIAGVVPAILIGMAAVWSRVCDSTLLRRSLIAVVALFCLHHGAYSLISAEWASGTRTFDFDFTRSPRQFAQESARLFQANGLARIEAYLRSEPDWPRVVGCTGLENSLGMRLSARFEDVGSISWDRPEFTDTPEHFIAFLKQAQVGYLLVPRSDNASVPCIGGHVIIDVAAGLNSRGAAPVVHDEGYDLYAISAAWTK